MKSVLFFRLSVFFAALLLPLCGYAAPDFFAGQALISRPIPEELALFQKAYPDLTFLFSYDEPLNDWSITVRLPPDPDRGGSYETFEFYWAEGRLLPKEELSHKNNYTKILYEYPKDIPNRELLSKAERKEIRDEFSAANRKTSIGTPMFFFNDVYSAVDKGTMESHLVRTTFLGKSTRVHERIYYQLKAVEKKINKAAASDKEIQAFVKNLSSAAAYNWRLIAGTNRLSFHSYGIALDILPKKLGGKIIFWSYEAAKNPENWMAVPNSKKWIPPKKVIDFFEQEGFIWGGKWMIYDNMHFEYHPELLYFNEIEVE